MTRTLIGMTAQKRPGCAEATGLRHGKTSPAGGSVAWMSETTPEGEMGRVATDAAGAGETEPKLRRPGDPEAPGSEGGDNGGA